MEISEKELLKRLDRKAKETHCSLDARTEAMSSYRNRCQLIVGIDPDVDESGVAVLNQDTKEIYTLRLPFEKLVYVLERIGAGERDHLIVIELDRYNTHDFHVIPGMGVQVAAKVGFNHGRNYQVAVALFAIAESAGHCRVIAQPPLVKCWRGKDRKITEYEMSCIRGLTIIDRHRTNQEERDAFLLAVHHTNITHWFDIGKAVE